MTSLKRKSVIVTVALASIVATVLVLHGWRAANQRAITRQMEEAMRKSPEELQALYKQLDDPLCGRPDEIVEEICKNRNNADGVKAIKRYVERKGGARDFDRYSRKLVALEGIGYVGGAEASSVLGAAFAEAGARQLAEAWFDGYNFVTQEEMGWLICRIRGKAAMGLARTCDPADMVEVAKEYERLVELRKKDPRSYKPFREVESKYTEAERQQANLFSALVEAMAEHEATAKMGRPFISDLNTTLKVLGPYFDKYDVPKRPE